MNNVKWRFGEGQTAREEAREIAEARRAGLAERYIEAQGWHRLRQAELEGRRARKASRRAGHFKT